ncbi:MAG: tetratricopeptide repeat protein, partial [Lentisphaeria bacterium]|nr:tetratricopeptide repeat protein [Lentisphaeria bacterium]NQZ71001.1 tetratricopeptide repeat protein [Lentisphaeria bacterium]
PKSTIEVFAQTSSGRKKAGKGEEEVKGGSVIPGLDIKGPTSAGNDDEKDKKPAGPPKETYDVNIPGTIKLKLTPSLSAGMRAPEGFKGVVFQGEIPGDALEDGVFTVNIPTMLGDVPDETLINKNDETAMKLVEGTDAYGLEARYERIDTGDERYALSVNGSDTIYVGFKYTDWDGVEHWLTKNYKLQSESQFKVMDRRYEKRLTGIYVGETIYMEVKNKMLDISPDRDKVKIQVRTNLGQKMTVELMETFEHTGVFRGLVRPQYKDTNKEGKEGELYVEYGGMIKFTYSSVSFKSKKTSSIMKNIRDNTSTNREEIRIEVYKGADGMITAFTKRFKDPDIAVQTQFVIAEAYFELAKKHRILKKMDLVTREIAQGKRLLEEAIRDFPDSKYRAQADYLLAELSLEFANDAPSKESKSKHYNEAMRRFSNIVGTYPDSEYAPKAQYKKALTFEKMGMLDNACEEYVKLSYRYPKHELVAETIARLGQYFWMKGKIFRKKSLDPATEEVQAFKLEKRALLMYKTSGEVFGRLGKRFPGHKLSGKTTVLSGQAFMQANMHEKAIEIFLKAIKKFDGKKNLVAEAMYWCGDSYLKSETADGSVNAWRMWKNLTWNFPDTKWAKYARGRLASEEMIEAESKANEAE